MTWRVARSPHTVDLITSMPVEGQLAFLDLLEALEVDPFAVTEPYGLDPHGADDKTVRQGSFGDFGLAVVFVNPVTARISVLSLTWTG